MAEGEEKTKVEVTVEVTDNTTKTILVAAVVVIGGVVIAMALVGGEGGVFGGGGSEGIVGNCGDGIDNDGGGQADRDDPDCYNEPEVWKGYDAERDESSGGNDPPGGRP